MHLLKNLSAICIVALLLLPSCSEEDEFSPYLEGDIIGYAYCFDEFGNEPEDFSGITVVTEPGRKYSAVTDADGRYVLKGVINGTYNLSFEKEGFGTMKLFGIEHLGGKPTVMEYYYGNKAPFVFHNITTGITHLEYNNDTIRAEVTFSGQYRPDNLYIRVFFSDEADFNVNTAVATRNIVIFKQDNTYWRDISSDIESLPFEPGETIYSKACLYSATDAIMLYNYYYISGLSTYYDLDTNNTIYPNLSNESNEFSFTMP